MTEEHKHWVSSVFDRAAAKYGENSSSFFNYFGKRLVELAEVGSSKAALDVATGKGAVLFPLAEAVGSSGKIAAIDISMAMIQEARLAAKTKKLDWIDIRHMDAEQIDFADQSFDFVFCGFGLFFFPNLPLTLKEFHRVLKPGGKIAVTIWGKESALKEWVNRETKKLCQKNNLAITPLWSKEVLQRALSPYFGNINILEEKKPFLHSSIQDFWEGLWSHGTRARLEQLTSDELQLLQKRAFAKAQSLQTEQGLIEELQVFYGFGQKQ